MIERVHIKFRSEKNFQEDGGLYHEKKSISVELFPSNSDAIYKVQLSFEFYLPKSCSVAVIFIEKRKIIKKIFLLSAEIRTVRTKIRCVK